MRTETFDLAGTTPGTRQTLTALRFGPAGGRPRATVQAALHADEVPALLVAQCLRQRLAALEAAGQLSGEVVLVPVANPPGLTQQLLGVHHGRFALGDGVNFNRGYADLAAAAAPWLEGRLGADEAANTRLAREALQRAAEALTATTTAQDLKRRLLQWAAASDIVLDLHCDAEAALHLYALTPQEPLAAELGALLGARAILLAEDSGDFPFDEACSRPWLLLRQRFAPHPIAYGNFAVTVELRGQRDTDHALAAQDADALIEFLRRRGVVAGTPGALPAARCRATPLAASEPIVAPQAGVVVFRAAVGDDIAVGQPVCDLVDVESGDVATLAARSAGVLYARAQTRWAEAGQRLAKIAGTTLVRTGRLLGP